MPDAAAIVFESGAPLTMAGLDVTHQFIVTPERIESVATMGTTLASLIADLFRFFSANYISRHDDIRGAALHDPLAVLAVTHPALFDSSDRHVAVETRGTYTSGMTVVDRRGISDRRPANARFLEHVDAAAAWTIVLDAIRAGAARSGQ